MARAWILLAVLAWTSCAARQFPSHFAVYGSYVQAGFVDLQPGMRLKIVRPVLGTGQALKTEVTAEQGLNLTIRSNVTGVDIQYKQPKDVGFTAEITHFRLFFLARDLDRGRKITLIGAHSRQELDAATRALDAYCGQANAPCMAVSEGTVIGAQIPVVVQGKQEFFPLGASVREAVPPGARVKLTRQWRGKRVPASEPSVLELPLNGGDSISYRM